MVFNFRSDESPDAPSMTYTWLIRFTEQVNFDKMQEAVSTALFEGKWGAGSWKKLKVRLPFFFLPSSEWSLAHRFFSPPPPRF